jgi:hypothetical protein
LGAKLQRKFGIKGKTPKKLRKNNSEKKYSFRKVFYVSAPRTYVSAPKTCVSAPETCVPRPET